jgi:hypothetical protein
VEITEVVGTVMDVTEQWNARTALEKAGVNFGSQLVVSRFGSIGFNIRMPSEYFHRNTMFAGRMRANCRQTEGAAPLRSKWPASFLGVSIFAVVA